ncbi:MAG TPA: hypothetical protein VID47_07320 [Actinomycetota bacterium]
MGDDGDTEDLDKLSDLLANPAKRKEFFLDPATALKAEDIDPDGIPEAFLEALTELDYDELGLLSRVNRKLVDAGLIGDAILNWPV